MIFIQNADGWWNLVKQQEEVILTLISRFHPLNSEIFGYAICPVDLAVKAIENQDSTTLRTILGETWFGTAILEEQDAVPGIEVLYALCNEAWILDEIAESI